jgi:hypothetical protein
MRGNTEVINVISNQTLAQGDVTRFGEKFPLGEGWLFMLLTINIALTVGSASGPITNGELALIKNIFLKSDKDGQHYNACGKSLYRNAARVMQINPKKDAIAAASATYRVSIPLFFSNPILRNPNDTILDTMRYKNIELNITIGTLADLFTTTTGASMVVTLDAEVVRTKGALLQKVRPSVFTYVKDFPQVNPAVNTYIELEKNSFLSMLTLLIQSANTVVSGVAFSGVPNDDVFSKLWLSSNEGYVFEQRWEHNIHAENAFLDKIDDVGYYFFNLIRDGSIFGAFPTGDKTQLRIEWLNDTLSTSGVSVLLTGIQVMKNRS